MDLVKELLNKFNNKDIKAFEEIYKKYYNMLLNKAWYDFEESEDMVQECFIKIWNGPAKFETIPQLESYLVKTITTLCIDELKKRMRRKEIRLDPDQLDNNSETVDFAEAVGIVSEDSVEKIRNEIDQLPAQCKLIFIMKHVNNLSVGQIAKKLNLARSTIYGQLKIAETKLREKFPGISIVFTGWFITLLMQSLLCIFLLVDTQKNLMQGKMNYSYKLHAM